MRTGYPTDLTDSQWATVEPFPPRRPGPGRPATVDFRPGGPGLGGRRATRPDPLSGTCIDSPSVKGTECTGNPGYDGGKTVKGRKRHILTDTLGLLLAVVVTAANVDDGAAAATVVGRLDRMVYSRLAVIFADQKYNNHDFEKWLADERPSVRLEVRSRPAGAVGFTPLRKRWVVERTFAWIGRCRRNSKDYARTEAVAEAMVQVSSIRLMLRLLDTTSERPTT